MSDSVRPYGLQPARILCPWGLSRQEYWSGLLCPPPGYLPSPAIFQTQGSNLCLLHLLHWQMGSLPLAPPGKPSTGNSIVKNPPANARDARDRGLIPGWGRSPGEGTAIHSSILAWKIPMDRGAWWATVHRVAESQTRLKGLSRHA